MIYKISIGNQIIDQVFTDFESAQQEAFELSSRDQLEPQIIEVKGKVILQPIFVAVESEAQKILDNFPPAPPEPKVPAKKKAVKKDPISLQNVSETVEPKQAPVQTLEPKPIVENVEVIDIGSEEVDDATQVLIQDQAFNEDLNPLEQAIEETQKPKTYKCSLGIEVLEEAVKQSCESRFLEAMKQGKTGLNLYGAERYLINLYPDINYEDWFNEMIKDNLKELSQKEDDLYCENKQLDELILINDKEDFINWLKKYEFLQTKSIFKINIDKKKKQFNIIDSSEEMTERAIKEISEVQVPEDLQAIAKKYSSLSTEEYIKAFSDKSDEFSFKDLEALKAIIENPNYHLSTIESMYKSPKFQSLSLTKYKADYEKLLDVITQKKKLEVQVDQLLSKLPTAKNPQELIKNYAPEVQNHHKIEEYFTQKLGIFQDGTKVPF